MKTSKKIMVMLIMFAVAISAFALPARSLGKAYATDKVTDLTGTKWAIKENADLGNGPEVGCLDLIIKYNGSTYDLFTYEMGVIQVGDTSTTQGGEEPDYLTIWEPGDASVVIEVLGGLMANFSEVIDILYELADLIVEEPAHTGVVADLVLPSAIMFTIVAIIAYVGFSSKRKSRI